MMLTILFFATTVTFGIGWFVSKIGTLSLLWYLQEKNCPLPNDEEMKTGCRFAVEHMIKDFFGLKRR